MTRWSLVARIGGNTGEMAKLVELYAPAIARYLSQKFPDQRAAGRLDDIVQETLIALLENPALLARAQPGEGSRFRYLVMTTAYLLARNALRRLSRHTEREVSASTFIQASDIRDVLQMPVTGGESTDDMDRAWAAGIIGAAWDDVRASSPAGSVDAQAIGMLHEHLAMGLSVRTLADRHQLPQTTCHRLLAKGRMRLQRAIIDRLRLAHEAEDLDPAQAYEMLASLVRRETPH